MSRRHETGWSLGVVASALVALTPVLRPRSHGEQTLAFDCRGRRLAHVPRSKDIKSCTGCHGPQLKGLGVVPAIAGRSPSYLLRQLMAFRSGARSTAASAPIHQVALTRSLDDMIAAAAFAGSRRP